MRALDFKAQDKLDASQWAQNIFASPEAYVILDTETTGLRNAQPIEIAITDIEGNALLNCRCKPAIPIEPGATKIHGIRYEDVADSPGFDLVWPLLSKICRDKTILIYNSRYDMGVLRNACQSSGIPAIADFANECVMIQYAKWFGDWNEKRRSYKWQKLEGGDHSALGDCRATLEVIREMACL